MVVILWIATLDAFQELVELLRFNIFPIQLSFACLREKLFCLGNSNRGRFLSSDCRGAVSCGSPAGLRGRLTIGQGPTELIEKGVGDDTLEVGVIAVREVAVCGFFLRQQATRRTLAAS